MPVASESATLDFKTVSFPCIAFRRDAGTLVPAILAASDGNQLVVFEPGSREPRTLPSAKFNEAFDPVVLLLAPRCGSSE